MKTFKDLKFKSHPYGDGKQAVMFFKNGYGISVIRFSGSYTSDDTEWEIGVLIGDKKESELCYTTPITDDVIGHLHDDEVTEIMKRIQNLK